MRNFRKCVLLIGIVVVFQFFQPKQGYTVPSFTRQTGMACNACHTVFPELTPFGRNFKLGGYVFSKSTKSYEFPPPVAGMAQFSFTNIRKDLPRGVIDENWTTHATSSDNNVFGVPHTLSLIYGGRILYKTGAFLELTFEGAEKDVLLDMADIRYADSTTLGGKNFMYGLTINNNPTLEDVWNSTPAFGFPSEVMSDVAPTPAARPIIDGGLEAQVGGMGAYGYWNNMVYGGFSFYRTAKSGVTRVLAAGADIETVVDNIAPYWRFSVSRDWDQHSFAVGTYGLVAKVFPEERTSGPTNRFTDVAFDAQYQYIGNKHIFSGQSTWIHEDQDLDASFAFGESEHRSGYLNTFKININYYHRISIGAVGGTLGYFSTTGKRDRLLYAPDPVEGSRAGRPNSSGFILQADCFLDFLSWTKGKLSLQYTIFNKFNGAQTNYDGFGRKASDNNTLLLFAWFAF